MGRNYKRYFGISMILGMFFGLIGGILINEIIYGICFGLVAGLIIDIIIYDSRNKKL